MAPASAGARLAVVTGAATGIGRETAAGLLRRGYHVVLAVRASRVDRALADLRPYAAQGPEAVDAFAVDLADVASVRAFAAWYMAKYGVIHVLINSAGIGGLRRRPEATSDGHDLCFRTNAVSPFLLTRLLLPALERGAPARLVNVSSVMHRWGTMDWEALLQYRPERSTYAASKLAVGLLASEVGRRYGDRGVTAVTVNPGAVNSDIWYRGQLGPWAESIARLVFGILFLTSAQGAATSIDAATNADYEGTLGVYLAPYWPMPLLGAYAELHGPFAGSRVWEPDGKMRNAAAARALWKTLDRAVGAG